MHKTYTPRAASATALTNLLAQYASLQEEPTLTECTQTDRESHTLNIGESDSTQRWSINTSYTILSFELAPNTSALKELAYIWFASKALAHATTLELVFSFATISTLEQFRTLTNTTLALAKQFKTSSRSSLVQLSILASKTEEEPKTILKLASDPASKTATLDELFT
ncbi:MAG: hypothetical protein P3M74_00240 [Candidatus Hodgkinia cicadicola]|nr:MAG: hypothetical protein P3M74_00240 [Candidatus Hodgkinia cicadicola]